MTNPFVYGEVVPAVSFVDRETELDRLTRDLLAGQKIFLISPRRYGKSSLVRQAYVEFDLEAIMAGESYADFALLWHLAHRSRLEPRLADGAEEGSAPTVHACYFPT